jgi:hypothetical protein
MIALFGVLTVVLMRIAVRAIQVGALLALGAGALSAAGLSLPDAVTHVHHLIDQLGALR